MIRKKTGGGCCCCSYDGECLAKKNNNNNTIITIIMIPFRTASSKRRMLLRPLLFLVLFMIVVTLSWPSSSSSFSFIMFLLSTSSFPEEDEQTKQLDHHNHHPHHNNNNNDHNNQATIHTTTTTLRTDPPFVPRPKDVTSPFAYVFLLGGLDPKYITPFRGYLYNIMIATNTLRSSGSQADIVLLIQPLYPNKNQTLSLWWENLLQNDLGIKIQYLDNTELQQNQQQEHHQQTSFFSVMLQKFKVLQMTQYQRILFLDGDIVPFCNLDYLFEASMKGIIQPQFVLAGSDAPAAGNFFLITPKIGDYELLLQQIVLPTIQRHQQQQHVSSVSSLTWNGEIGWGYKIPYGDEWERLSFGGSKFIRHYWPWQWHEKGRHWNFHGGSADQGLLYHWVKYVKRNVTIAIGPIIETWMDNNNKNHNKNDKLGLLVDQPILVNRTLHHPLHDMSCRRRRRNIQQGQTRTRTTTKTRFFSRTGGNNNKDDDDDFQFQSKEGLTVPYSDYEHNKKIWEKPYPSSSSSSFSTTTTIKSRYNAKTPSQFWFYSLQLLNEQYQLQIDYNSWLQHIGNKQRPLGTGPKVQDLYK